MKTPCAPDGEADCVSSLVVVGRWGTVGGVSK